MGKSKTYPPEIKREIIGKVREGMPVKEVERRYGVSTKTVYKWVGGLAQGKDVSVLEIGRLKRENEALYKIVGRLTYELKSGKKS